MGLFILEADVYNYAMALPNKFFDYVSAGLPVCIGPSPAMAELALEHGFGCVARGFGPRDVADALNALDEQALERMRRAARAAARTLNADVEMGKLVMLFHRLLGDQPAAAHSVTTSGETR
jgi:alkanesulfonate monooxygenase SsuD/methylene tetrahydromethanopterin reductase-like flavin-dependent oxidoreductase (luciferase family)